MNKNKTITFGDKIFTRVTRNGQTIYNFVSEKVSNMADLLSQVRRAVKDIHGLVMLHIRNYNQGWGDERPLMLYAPKTSHFVTLSSDKISPAATLKEPVRKSMFFPWETH